jgi:hypothetical protein
MKEMKDEGTKKIIPITFEQTFSTSKTYIK